MGIRKAELESEVKEALKNALESGHLEDLDDAITMADNMRGRARNHAEKFVTHA